MPVLKEALEILVALDNPDPQDQLECQDLEETLDHQGLQVQLVSQVSLELLVLLALQVLWDLPAIRDPVVIQELLVCLVTRVIQATQDLLVLVDPMDRLDDKVIGVYRVQQDLLVPEAMLVSRVKLVSLVPPDSRVRQGVLA